MRSMVEGALRAPAVTRGRARRLRREMTLPEVLLWQALRKQRLPGLRFRRQHPVGAYILDFFCPSAHLAVEVDGSAHDHAARVEHDERRGIWLAQRGITVLRIPAVDVLKNLESVVLAIEQAASPSGALRAPPPPLCGGGSES